MIRFIDIGDQIACGNEGPRNRDFALFNTVRGRFIEINNEYTWKSYAAVQHDLLEELEKENISEDYYERVLNLIPEEFR